MEGRTYVPYWYFENAFPRWGKDLHVVWSRIVSESRLPQMREGLKHHERREAIGALEVQQCKQNLRHWA